MEFEKPIQEPTEDQWNERRKEGHNIAKYCEIIAFEMGTPKGGGIFHYSDTLIRIEVNRKLCGLELSLFVQYANATGSKRLSMHLGELQSYDPHPIEWVEHVRELGAPLLAAEEAEEERKKVQERNKYLRSWGFYE